MEELAKSPYDDVAYPSAALPQTHPERLATIAVLFGMSPAPAERCRVLELGCGDGANLVPMAYGLRGSEFVGMDLAARPIAAGQEAVKGLGLGNIQLRQANLLEITSDWGPFDYIIAHGLYAWAPPQVQDKLMEVCRGNLSANGVAYVSYNAYPGSHLRDMLRQMMLWHLRDVKEPLQKTKEAMALAKFLAAPRAKPDVYQEFMKAEAALIEEHAQGSLYHDELAETYCPVYFHQFVEHAARHQLQYLGEADFYEMQDQIYPFEVRRELDRLASTRLLREQYLDFLKCRRFRQTLLCHERLRLEPAPGAERVKHFLFSSKARPASAKPDLVSSRPERFEGRKGAALETDHPLAKAAIYVLGQAWPQRFGFDDLLLRARNLCGTGPGADRGGEAEQTEALCEILLRIYSAGLIEFHLHDPGGTLEAGEHPEASALARFQIHRGNLVTNLYHHPVMIEGDLAGALLRLLDGTRDRSELVAELAAIRRSQGKGGPGTSVQELHDREMGEQLEQQLGRLGRLGLLVR